MLLGETKPAVPVARTGDHPEDGLGTGLPVAVDGRILGLGLEPQDLAVVGGHLVDVTT